MPRAVVITGPSGVGKGTLIRSLRERMPELQLSISATTRLPRAGETQDVDYHFMSPEDFDRHVAAGDFVEHADYAGARYGTLRSELQTRSSSGAPVVLEIEVQGARQVRESMPEAVQVFIAPPSIEALRVRLVGRGTDAPEQVEARLRTAEAELAAQHEFAHVVVNDRLEDAVEALRARLVGRGTDDPHQIEARLRTAERELEAQDEFAYVVVNDRLEDAVGELVAIVRATTSS